MGVFFSHPTNLRVVEQSMNRLLEAMSKIDTDCSLRLTKSELDELFKEHFLVVLETGLLEKTIKDLFSTPVMTCSDMLWCFSDQPLCS